MKYFFIPILAFSALVFHSNGQDDNSDREVAYKKTQLDFPSTETIPKKWRPEILPFDQWLKLVTFPDWELLHSEESEDFFVAIFRDNSHVIVWTADRKGAFKSTSRSVNPVDKKANPNAILWPSKWVNLDIVLASPNVKTTYRAMGDATSIAPEYSGKLKIDYTVYGDEPADGGKKEKREVLSKVIDWKKDWTVPKAD